MRSRDPVPHLEPGGWLSTLALYGTTPAPENTAALLERLGRPQEGLKLILVAGTNGKGSTAKLLSASLAADGRRVGLFVSPHLSEVTERIVTDDEPIDAESFGRLLERVRPAATELGSTFFEVLTAAALLRFAQTGVEWGVVEVGLGGRLDPTNALDPLMSLVAPIALDHQAVLGGDLESIAREKAGILRPGRPALTSAEGVALRAVRIEAARTGSELAVLGEEFAVRVISSSWLGLELELWFDAGWLAKTRSERPAVSDLEARTGAAPPARLNPPLRLTTPLVGRHQAVNLALAAAAALCLGVEPGSVVQAAAGVAWPGRLERLRYLDRWVVFDGAHNPHGALALAGALAEVTGTVDSLVLSVGRDKHAGEVAGPLLRLGPAVVATEADASGRFYSAAALADEISRETQRQRASGIVYGAEARPVEAVVDPHAAMELALALTPLGGTLVVAGSLHLVGELRSRLMEQVQQS